MPVAITSRISEVYRMLPPAPLRSLQRLLGNFLADSKVFLRLLRSVSWKEFLMHPSEQVVQWRAQLIKDPVKRLRYLRQVHHLTPAPPPVRSTWPRHWRLAAIALLLALLGVRSGSDASIHRSPVARQSGAAGPAAPIADVWLVESNPAYEIYSNGLRVENRLTVSNQPRAFIGYDRSSSGLAPGLFGSNPVGIVYHTTESHGAPFEPRQNQTLKRQGQALLEFVRDKRAYNFVIDRFGRVHRIVQESDTAFHAGHSVWADAKWVYIELNSSFLGVAFEGETEHLRDSLTPAQIHAGRVLTEMLRSRFHIAAGNCVTHAQVSVNPDNMRVGYHTDWAGNFPFHEMGLDDNYAQPIPALYVFGFGYDPMFVESTGARLWKGLMLAEDRLLEDATVNGRTVAEYKNILRKRYHEKLAGIENKGESKGVKL